MRDGPPTLRFLRAQYLLLLAASGAFGPYVGLHLRRLGWSDGAIAAGFAVWAAIWVFSGPAWAALADRLDRRGRMFALLGLAGAASVAVVAVAPSTPAVALGLAGAALFRGPLSVLLDGQIVATLEARGQDVRRYGTVRLWGSLGFLGAAMVGGRVAEVSTTAALGAAAAVLAVASVLGLRLDGVRSIAPRARPAPAFDRAVHDPVLRRLLVAAVLHGAALAAYDGYFAMLLADRGVPAGVAGLGLAVGVLAEIAVMQHGSRVLARVPPARVLAVAGGVAAVRLLLCAGATSPAVLVGLQALHGVAFGAWWVALVEIARRRSPPGVRAGVQAVAGSAAYGVGPLLCQGAAAAVIGRAGVPALFVVAALFAVAGALVAAGLRVPSEGPAPV